MGHKVVHLSDESHRILTRMRKATGATRKAIAEALIRGEIKRAASGQEPASGELMFKSAHRLTRRR